MSLTLNDLYVSPDHYLHSFDGDDAIFMPMDRDAYHRSIFLDDRISPAIANRTMRVPAATIAQAWRPAQPTSWIFHMAHCGSTLLARALDDSESSLVLREPMALRQTALSPFPELVSLVATMLSKRYRADAPTLVKANVPVNFLLPQLAAVDPQARAILLYLPFREYLLAILRSDNHRIWLREVTDQVALHLGGRLLRTDAERTAALWLAQVQAYDEALTLLPNARALDAGTFFAQPREVLGAAARQLQIPLADSTLDAVTAGPMFTTYSKDPSKAFDNAARLARRAEAEQALAAELDEAEAWAAANAPKAAPDAALIERALIR